MSKPPTHAQQAATARNWSVFKLRGLHSQMSMLTGVRRDMARYLVDLELVAMGAKSQVDHEADRRNALFAKIVRDRERRRLAGDPEDDIPF